jgi:hypothetical protein
MRNDIRAVFFLSLLLFLCTRCGLIFNVCTNKSNSCTDITVNSKRRGDKILASFFSLLALRFPKKAKEKSVKHVERMNCKINKILSVLRCVFNFAALKKNKCKSLTWDFVAKKKREIYFSSTFSQPQVSSHDVF